MQFNQSVKWKTRIWCRPGIECNMAHSHTVSLLGIDLGLAMLKDGRALMYVTSQMGKLLQVTHLCVLPCEGEGVWSSLEE